MIQKLVSRLPSPPYRDGFHSKSWFVLSLLTPSRAKGSRPKLLHFVRGSAERTDLRDLPPWDTPGPLPRSPGPPLRRTKSAGGSARALGGAGWGSQQRGALPGQQAAGAPGVPLALPAELAARTRAWTGSPRAAGGALSSGPLFHVAQSGPAQGATCASVPQPHRSPQPRHFPTPARGSPQVGACSPLRRVPHRQMVLLEPHPRGCGAPKGRTGPCSAQPLPALPVKAATSEPCVLLGLGEGGAEVGKGSGGGGGLRYGALYVPELTGYRCVGRGACPESSCWRGKMPASRVDSLR
ncbi:protein tfg-1-like [Pezoporus occidentalis]|uniref:protein tfg-1-like n=1 Tax=Pezoporus occidentalis TaxID=407982 RepID=UPI002F9187A6